MKFAIASVEFWQGVGFDVTSWRKSVDESMAMVHLEFAKVLVPDIEQDTNVEIYDSPSEEFTALLESEAWTHEDIS